jgi:signal transduction histidine kinase
VLKKCKWNLQEREVKPRKYLEVGRNSYMILVTCRRISSATQTLQSVKVYNKFLEILGTIWQKCQLARQSPDRWNFCPGGQFLADFFRQTAENETDLVASVSRRAIRPIHSIANDKLEESLVCVPSIIYQCAADLTVTTVSRNSTELIGVRPEKLLGNRILWDERLFVEDRQGLLSRIDRLRPGEVSSETHRIIDDRGLPVWVSHSVRKLTNETDAALWGCIIPLPTSFQSKCLDSGVISEFVHKIGNHFQLINLLLGSLKRGVKLTSEIETLQETVDRAVEFTRAFMHYGQSPTGLSEVDLGEILRQVIDSNAPFFVERKVVLKDLIQELNGALINGDPVLLDLAFCAILQNALDATSGGDRVVISGKYYPTCLAGQPVARISIADSGCGMESDFLEKAMSPFFTSKPNHDGLGLSMTVRIIESHGGRLHISSNKSHGTEVEITLPIRDTKVPGDSPTVK